MKKFIIISLLFLVSIPAFASEWVQIDNKIYVDRESVSYFKHYGDRHVEFWLKALNDKSKRYSDYERILKTKVWYDKSLCEINCAKKEIIIRDTVIYGLNHNVLYSLDDKLSEWYKVVPDSIGELYYNMFCK